MSQHHWKSILILQPTYFQVFRPFTKTLLTFIHCHDDLGQIFSLCGIAMPQPTSLIPHWLLSCAVPISSLLIGHQDTWLIIISHLLIIIPGICITLHACAMSRSLIIPLKPCSILLKFVSQYIVTLYLFYHCISMFISYALCIKT